MKLIRILLSIFILGSIHVHAVTGNVNVQFLLGNTETGVMEGNYTVTFSLLTSRDQPLNEAIWNESHTIYITQGKVSEVLGQKRPLNYHLFKGDDVFLSLSFQEIDDTVTVPIN